MRTQWSVRLTGEGGASYVVDMEVATIDVKVKPVEDKSLAEAQNGLDKEGIDAK